MPRRSCRGAMARTGRLVGGNQKRGSAPRRGRPRHWCFRKALRTRHRGHFLITLGAEHDAIPRFAGDICSPAARHAGGGVGAVGIATGLKISHARPRSIAIRSIAAEFTPAPARPARTGIGTARTSLCTRPRIDRLGSRSGAGASAGRCGIATLQAARPTAVGTALGLVGEALGNVKFLVTRRKYKRSAAINAGKGLVGEIHPMASSGEDRVRSVIEWPPALVRNGTLRRARYRNLYPTDGSIGMVKRQPSTGPASVRHRREDNTQRVFRQSCRANFHGTSP